LVEEGVEVGGGTVMDTEVVKVEVVVRVEVVTNGTELVCSVEVEVSKESDVAETDLDER
jgi:hypothetical protein